MDKGGSILLSTTYGERRNVVLRLSLPALAGPDALAYFTSALAERHEEASEALDFYIRLPAPGSITGVAEIRVDSAADLRSLKCVARRASCTPRASSTSHPLTPAIPSHSRHTRTHTHHTLLHPLFPGNLTPLWCAARTLQRRRARCPPLPPAPPLLLLLRPPLPLPQH